MKRDEQPEPKPQAGQPPPRPPRRTGVMAGCGGDDDDEPPRVGMKKETVRIALPPKPSWTGTVVVDKPLNG